MKKVTFSAAIAAKPKLNATALAYEFKDVITESVIIDNDDQDAIDSINDLADELADEAATRIKDFIGDMETKGNVLYCQEAAEDIEFEADEDTLDRHSKGVDNVEDMLDRYLDTSENFRMIVKNCGKPHTAFSVSTTANGTLFVERHSVIQGRNPIRKGNITIIKNGESPLKSETFLNEFLKDALCDGDGKFYDGNTTFEFTELPADYVVKFNTNDIENEYED